MGAPDSPTGLPKLDPNDRERDIVTAFNRLVDMVEARTPSYYASESERNSVWGTPGLYDRPQAIVGGTWKMWEGDHWATIATTDSAYEWTPYLYTGNLTPFSNPNQTMYTQACMWMPIADNLAWFKISVGFTQAGCDYLASRAPGELIQCSLPVNLTSVWLGGGGNVRRGGERIAANWYATSLHQIAWSHSSGPVCVNSFNWKPGDGLFGSGVVSI